VFAVIPLFHLPLIGLSVTTPLFVPVAAEALFAPPTSWFRRYRGWLLLACAIWVGMLVSQIASSIAARESPLEKEGILTLVRYAYWILVFCVTAYVGADRRVGRRLALVLRVSLVALACLRWVEGLAFGKIGAWTDTVFLTQNDYGVLFSTFFPFLLVPLAALRWKPRLVAFVAMLLVWGAAAINGSRGSWIGMAVGFVAFGVVLVLARPGAALRLLRPVALGLGLLLAFVLTGPGRVQEAVVSRFSTMSTLELDKSFMIRQALNQKSWRLFAESPFFGIGLGKFRDVYMSLDLPEVFTSKEAEESINRKASHNSYLTFLAEGGLSASLPLFLLLVALAGKGFLAAVRLARQGELWALSVFSGFVGMGVHLWVNSGITNTATWYVYGLVAAMVVLAKRSRARAGRPVVAGRAQFRRLARRIRAVQPGVPLFGRWLRS
jgi:O-antigen ligase